MGVPPRYRARPSSGQAHRHEDLLAAARQPQGHLAWVAAQRLAHLLDRMDGLPVQRQQHFAALHPGPLRRARDALDAQAVVEPAARQLVAVQPFTCSMTSLGRAKDIPCLSRIAR